MELIQELRNLYARMEATNDRIDRDEATGWLVVCIDLESIEHSDDDCVVACYGPFESPEEALVEAGRHDKNSLPVEPGWTHLVKPLFGPVFQGR